MIDESGRVKMGAMLSKEAVYRSFALTLWDWACRKTGHKVRQGRLLDYLSLDKSILDTKK